jgi:hypothetical protein
MFDVFIALIFVGHATEFAMKRNADRTIINWMDDLHRDYSEPLDRLRLML